MSSRSNTTQASHLGAFTEGAAQVTLYDTPGVVITRRARPVAGVASQVEELRQH